jgi:acid phosphatase family membrane protein YuiD
MGNVANWPAWALVLLCGAAAQASKFLIYSAARGRPALRVLGESVGLPSLHAAVLTCLTTVLAVRQGWRDPQTGVALVFAVIVVHDAMRLKGANQAQKEMLRDILDVMGPNSHWQRQMTSLLNVRVHHPLHVAIGVIFGLLFALALGVGGS